MIDPTELKVLIKDYSRKLKEIKKTKKIRDKKYEGYASALRVVVQDLSFIVSHK